MEKEQVALDFQQYVAVWINRLQAHPPESNVRAMCTCRWHTLYEYHRLSHRTCTPYQEHTILPAPSMPPATFRES